MRKSCASRGHIVRLGGLCRFDVLAGMEPPHGASGLKLERWPHATSALRERAAGQAAREHTRPRRMQGLTHLAHLLRHH